MSSDFLTTEQAAHRSGVSRPTVSRALKSGELPAIRDNSGKWLIDPLAVDLWAESRSSVQSERRAHIVQNAPHEQLEQLRIMAAEARERAAASDARATLLAAQVDDLRAERDRLIQLLESRPHVVGFFTRLFGR